MIKSIALFYFTLTFIACATTRTSETSYSGNSRITSVTASNALSTTELTKLKEEWEYEILTQEGKAPLINKYDNGERNKMLARKGAILDAQRKLGEKIGTIRLSASTSMSDFQTSDYVKSQLNVYMKEVEVINENYDEELKVYSATIQMPKIKLVNVIEEYLVR